MIKHTTAKPADHFPQAGEELNIFVWNIFSSQLSSIRCWAFRRLLSGGGRGREELAAERGPTACGGKLLGGCRLHPGAVFIISWVDCPAALVLEASVNQCIEDHSWTLKCVTFLFISKFWRFSVSPSIMEIVSDLRSSVLGWPFDHCCILCGPNTPLVQQAGREFEAAGCFRDAAECADAPRGQIVQMERAIKHWPS